MNRLLWYPPAETRIPPRAFARALLTARSGFESSLCSFLGAQRCVSANSGRALMTMLLQTLKKADNKNRDQVLIPAYTCYSVAASVVKAGLKIAVYDLDPHTFAPDEASLKAAAGGATLAIVHQHLFGIPQPAGPVHQAAGGLGIPVIEDAAQGLGGFLNGTPMGAMADYGIFSFGRGKPLAAGCGGALTGNSETLESIKSPAGTKGAAAMCTSMAVQVLSHPLLYGIMERLPLGLGRTIFDPGFAVGGMPQAVKRLAKSLLADLGPSIARRRSIADVYRSCLPDSRTVPEPQGAQPAYPRFPFLAGPGEISDRLFRRGVRRMYPRALIDEPEITRYFAGPGIEAPGARQIARDLVTLPTHSRITRQTARRLSELLMEEC
jgi:dTDP-4-amino-4,6-dideoxygalactose transaminase